jgi:capsular exopolysaccharide synthesis family protein
VNGTGPPSRNGHDTPRESKRLRRGLVTALEPNGAPAEAFRMLRTSLQFEGAGERLKTLMVTSSGPSDGKSTTLSNLAIAFAHAGERVLVLDGEVRRPVQHTIFDVPRAPGLTESLAGTSIAAPFRTRIPNLEVLTTGREIDVPGDAIVSRLSRMKAILNELQSRYDIILIDTPPILLVHDTALFAKMADGVVLVVNSNRSDAELLGRARQILAAAGARVVGTVLNHVDPTAVYGYRAYAAK